MNKYYLCVLLTVVLRSAWSQSISQLTITPLNPTPADTLYVISTLTYSGNCSYGLVYTYTSVTGNTIQIMPTYCGYGYTTTCTSTDTFKIAPLALGNYIIKIEYHQGHCPVSNFDALLGRADTAISVSNIATTLLKSQTGSETGLRLYPNPAAGNVTIDLPGTEPDAGWINVRTVLGKAVLRKKAETRAMILDLESLSSGVYIIELESSSGLVSKQRLLVQER